MSSSDQLKRAAAKLREAAAKATPGPWEFVPDLYGDRGAITSTAVAVGGWDTLIIDVPNDSESPAAEWIALASPVIAEPIAVWLTRWADLIDRAPQWREGPFRCDQDHAIAVARAILGEDS